MSLTRISFPGLDPAGPLFYVLNTHLTAKDADFVDIIHTDMGIYGLALSTGHVDFFPNNAVRPQPGCALYGPILSETGSFLLNSAFYNRINDALLTINRSREIFVHKRSCNICATDTFRYYR
ncbi:Endothelial lipase [Habropoda laboriosa]|uniref:phospholipase A1 n=1 Tax=Habropoda laboriosa TaxID=597456 RepID=A0A0L7QUS8_9HYME|nr:Endothelial lipase [Habropoda laboriosa]